MKVSTQYKDKQEYILTMGMTVLSSKGYNGTSVNDIVSAASIPKGSFYNYFESKEDFAVKALCKYFDEIIDEVSRVLDDKSKSYKQRLIAHYESRVGFMLTQSDFKNGCISNSLGNEMGNHSESIRRAIIERESLINAKLTEIVNKGKGNGEINNRLDSEVLVNFIEDAWKGAMISRNEYQSNAPLHNLLTVVKSLLD